MKRLKKQCHHLHLNQRFSSWLLFSIFLWKIWEADFLDAMKRDSYYSHKGLRLNYSLKIKNNSLINLFDVAFKLKATASNVDSELLEGEKSLRS